MIKVLFKTISYYTISTPFKRQKNTSQNSVISTSNAVAVGLTHAILSKNQTRNKIFWRYTEKVIDQLDTMSRLIGYSVQKEIFGNEGWTIAVQNDTDSMHHFARSSLTYRNLHKEYSTLEAARFARTS